MKTITYDNQPLARSNRIISNSGGASMPAVPVQKQGNKTEEELPAQGKFATQLKGEEEELPAQGKFATQLKGEEEELPVQGKFIVQKKGGPEEEEPLQMKATQLASAEEELPVQQKANNTGLPDNLKSGVENLSGYAMDDVKVHYNSPKPAQLNAHAYAQGTDIHVASGQEKHLAHEAWHVVQQKQGRVQATMQMKGGVAVNDDAGLENEADTMGAKAVQMKAEKSQNGASTQIIQRYTVPVRARFSDLGIARSQNAGIRNFNITQNGVAVTEHYHCNGWRESTRYFRTFTGTFVIANVVYHYNISANGTGRWQNRPAGAVADGLRDRTWDWFGRLTAPA